MSGAAFEGLPALSGGARQDYVPGDTAMYGLAAELVGAYLSIDEPFEAKAYFSEADIAARLSAVEPPDCQGFLDILVASLAKEVDRRHAANAHILLSPAINALHACGCDSLSMDLTSLATPAEYPLMRVSGSRERKLELTLKVGDQEGQRGAFFVGHYLKHCSLRLIGSAQALGQWGEESNFLVEGSIPYLGWRARGCSFMLPRAAEIVCLANRKITTGFDDEVLRYELSFKRERREGSVFLDEGYPSIESLWMDSNFFLRGNTLLIPGEDGEWKEVTP